AGETFSRASTRRRLQFDRDVPLHSISVRSSAASRPRKLESTNGTFWFRVFLFSWQILITMPYFTLFYDTVDNFAQRRQPAGPAHWGWIDEAHGTGRLVSGGVLNPAAGALLVFFADDAAEVEEFAAGDPYVTSGLVTRWRVHEWAVVVGEHAVAR